MSRGRLKRSAEEEVIAVDCMRMRSGPCRSPFTKVLQASFTDPEACMLVLAMASPAAKHTSTQSCMQRLSAAPRRLHRRTGITRDNQLCSSDNADGIGLTRHFGGSIPSPSFNDLEVPCKAVTVYAREAVLTVTSHLGHHRRRRTRGAVNSTQPNSTVSGDRSASCTNKLS